MAGLPLQDELRGSSSSSLSLPDSVLSLSVPVLSPPDPAPSLPDPVPSISSSVPSLSDPIQCLPDPARPQPLPTPSHAALATGLPAYDPTYYAKSRRRSPGWYKIKNIANPSSFGILFFTKAPMLSTVRNYSRNRQLKRLLFNCVIRLSITIALCVLAGAILRAYYQLPYLTGAQTRVFNALLTAIPVAIGLNVASSLRAYAKMLRWKILASAYRPLKEVALILNCAEQQNILKLLWQTRRPRYAFVPNKTQLFCLAWLSVNLAQVIGIALLGLSYSFTPSPAQVITEKGLVSVLDVSNETSLETVLDDLTGNLVTAKWEPLRKLTSLPALDIIFSCDNNDDCWGFWEYSFLDYNPASFLENLSEDEHAIAQKQTSVFSISGRTINATAQCLPLPVINITNGDYPTVTYRKNNQNVVQFFDSATPGGLQYMYDDSENCGDRCAAINVFQISGDISTTYMLACTNKVGHMEGGSGTASSAPEYRNLFKMNDSYAIGVASGIAIYMPVGGYLFDSSWNEDLSSSLPQFVADDIASFSMTALANLDSSGPEFRRTIPGKTPIIPPYLDMNWPLAGAVLCMVPMVQLLTFLAVIAWAGNVIIKDDSSLSIGQLWVPLLRQLGPHGCLLDGNELATALGDLRVSYNFSEGEDGCWHVGLFAKSSHLAVGRRFDEGLYDGEGGCRKPERRGQQKQRTPLKASVVQHARRRTSRVHRAKASRGVFLRV